MPVRRPLRPLSAALLSAALGCSPGDPAATTSPAPARQPADTGVAAPASAAASGEPTADPAAVGSAGAAGAAGAVAPAGAAGAAGAAAGAAGAAAGAVAKKKVCGATHVVAAGETLRTISDDCYGSHAYLDLLRRRNGLKGDVVKAGTTLQTPPLRDLVKCAPREVCEPLFAAYASFRRAQEHSDHASVAPAAAFPHLDQARRNIEAALKAAEARKLKKPQAQLRSALDEIARLRAGKKHEPGYPEHTFHQHLVFALGKLEP